MDGNGFVMAGDSRHAPRFSILLPTHNRPDVLVFAIRSVLGQTAQDFELLIVGDGCTDRTAEVVKGFGDPRIRWFDLPKAPHFGYANRNIALRQARGACIAFMAHDDLWLPDHLELLSSCLEEHDAELVYSRPVWVAPDGTITPGAFNLNDAKTLEAFLSRKRNGIPAGCVLHRRVCFDRYGYWDDTLPACGDWDMWARIIEGGRRKNFAYLSVSTHLHFLANWRRIGSGGRSRSDPWKRIRADGNLVSSALTVPVPTGLTEQEALWRVMAADPRKWARELRVAIQRVLDSHATEFGKIQRSSSWKLVRPLRRVVRSLAGS